MTRLNDVDARVLGAMSGAERIRLLLRDAGFRTLAAFAQEIGKLQQEVSYCVNGEREYPEIRDQIAHHLGLTRERVDGLIRGESEEAA